MADDPQTLSMNRYAVFAGDDYYPAGGWNDLAEDFATLAEAEAYVKDWLIAVQWGEDIRQHWWHIVDLSTGMVGAQND